MQSQESWAAPSVSSCGPKCPFYPAQVPQLVCFRLIAAPVSTTMLKKSKSRSRMTLILCLCKLVKRFSRKQWERWGKRRPWLGFWGSKILLNPSLNLLGQHHSFLWKGSSMGKFEAQKILKRLMELSPYPAVKGWVFFLPPFLQASSDSTSNLCKALECPQKAVQVVAEMESRPSERKVRF